MVYGTLVIAVRGSICASDFIVGPGAADGTRGPWARTAAASAPAARKRAKRLAFMGWLLSVQREKFAQGWNGLPAVASSPWLVTVGP
jgi:hypothetical protein